MQTRKVILFLFLSLLIVGCSKKANAPDELVMVIEKKIDNLDPRKSTDAASERIRQLIFNTLTKKDDKFEPVPDLAERFDVSPDLKTFTFYLKSGVKFHNGKTLTAKDVKYTFDTLIAPDFTSGKRGEVADVLSTIEVKDDKTIVFNCKKPFPGFPNLIVPIGIIPEGSGDTQAKNPIGTGPFKFESYVVEQEVKLVAHTEYFAGAPAINKLRVMIVPDNSTRESEMRKGSADMAINADFDPITVESLQSAAGVKVDKTTGTNVTHIGINLKDSILSDKKVRQAIAYALDREAIIRDVLRGQAKLASSVLPLSHWAYNNAVKSYNYDPQRAKQLLKESGKSNLKLTLKTSTNTMTRKVAETIQEQLRGVGITLEIQPQDFGKFTSDLKEGNFQLYFIVAVGGNQSTDYFKYAYGTESIATKLNRPRYSNPELDKLLASTLGVPRDKQKEIYAQVQNILAEDLPHIYLWYMDTIIVHRDRVTNINPDPSGNWEIIRNVKLSN